MSIASELTTLANNKANIKAAIESKNPLVSPTDALAQWPSAVASIQNTPIQDNWSLPRGWPDVRRVVNNDPFANTSGVVSRVVLLVRVNPNTNLPDITSSTGIQGMFCFYNADGCIGGRTSNAPDSYEQINIYSSVDWAIDWDASKYIAGADGEKFVWLELYFRSTSVGLFNNDTHFWNGVVWCCGDGVSGATIYPGLRFNSSLQAITGFASLNAGAYGFEYAPLRTVPPLLVNASTTNLTSVLASTNLQSVSFSSAGNLSAVQYWDYAFMNSCLEEFPDIFFEGNSVVEAYAVAVGVYTIKRFPATMDFSSIAQYGDQIWNHCLDQRSLATVLPTKTIWPNVSTVDIGTSRTYSPSALAQFDANDNLIGGWMYGWQRCAAQSTNLTVDWHNNDVSWMTAAQKQAVVDHLSAKGINLINF